MHDYQESVTIGQTNRHTDRQTPDKMNPMCRYSSHARQKCNTFPQIPGVNRYITQMWKGDLPLWALAYGPNVRCTNMYLLSSLNVHVPVFKPSPAFVQIQCILPLSRDITITHCHVISLSPQPNVSRDILYHARERCFFLRGSRVLRLI